MPQNSSSRLGYIDWMRGLACVFMFQTHCYDSWLGGEARQTSFYRWSREGGTLPAPMFLFLAGTSFALIIGKLLQKNLSAGQIARTTFLRGAEVLGWAYLFRLQEYAISWGWAPWQDLFRVDILNCIGMSMILMALVAGVVLAMGPRNPKRVLGITAVFVGLGISLLTPLIFTVWQPKWLPWEIESYINGVHNLGTPQGWLFPIFPWTAFAFAGLAIGFVIFSEWGRAKTSMMMAGLCGFGVALYYFALWLDARPVQIYPVYDFWRTSPNFFLVRVGILLGILFASYAWCKWGWGERGFSPLIVLGQASLLVYWVHIELVYGKYSILPHRAVGIRTATIGLIVICLGMLLLAWLRIKMREKFAAAPAARVPVAQSGS